MESSKSTHIGRPVKYTKRSFSEKLEAYLTQRKANTEDIISVNDFCIYAGITREYLSDHNSSEKKGTTQDFSDTIKRLKLEAEAYIERNALKGKLNPTIAIFCLKNNHGWTDKKEDENRQNLSIVFGGPPSPFTMNAVPIQSP